MYYPPTGDDDDDEYLTASHKTRPVSLPLDNPDWRADAFRDNLAGAARAPTQMAIAISAVVNRYLPHSAVRIFVESNHAVVNLCPTLFEDWTPLHLFARTHYDEQQGRVPHYVGGWWKGSDPRQNGVAFEIALASFPGQSGAFVVIGPDDETVLRIVQTILAEIEKNRVRARVYSIDWQESPEMVSEIDKIDWNDIILPGTLRTDIENTVTQFFSQREIFERLRFPWRRGILLVGPPGTGKTMICKAIGAAFPQYPFLYVREVGRRQNGASEVEHIFKYARRHAPCILAFEDLDSLIDPSRRSVFLNEIDGFQNNDGLLIIASSNHPERIDEALLKRPSRFDRVYHIGLPALAEREAYARHLLARAPNVAPELDGDTLTREVAERTEGFTPAFIKEAFVSAMLQSAQENRLLLDSTFATDVLEQIEILHTQLKQTNNPAKLNEVIGAASDEGIGFRTRRLRGEPR